MFGNMNQKDLVLVFSVVGFGSVSLVALGELSNVKDGGPLFEFYLNLVFGGLAAFYGVFVHFATVSFTRKIDKSKKKSKFTKMMLGEKASYSFVIIILTGILVFWIYTFAQLMGSYGLDLF